ncbi:MAG: hypothetical protein ACRENE_03115 [Polyangiaceae bacterium]
MALYFTRQGQGDANGLWRMPVRDGAPPERIDPLVTGSPWGETYEGSVLLVATRLTEPYSGRPRERGRGTLLWGPVGADRLLSCVWDGERDVVAHAVVGKTLIAALASKGGKAALLKMTLP